MRRAALLSAAALALAGCGSSVARVCNVRPSANGRTLIYSPAGCQKHLGKGSTLNIQP